MSELFDRRFTADKGLSLTSYLNRFNNFYPNTKRGVKLRSWNKKKKKTRNKDFDFKKFIF